MTKISREKYTWENIMKTTKQKDGVIAIYLNRKIARHIAYYLANHTNVTPNQVTFMVFFVSIIASLLFLTGQRLYLIVGGLLAQLSFTLDCTDGELARLKNMNSGSGVFFDPVIDRISVTLLIFTLSLGSFLQSKNYIYLIYSSIVISLFYINEITQVWLEKAFGRSIREIYNSELSFFSNLLKKIRIDPNKVIIGYGADLIWFVIFLGAITNLVYFMLIFFILTNILMLTLTFYKVKRNA